jgi:hypothetical protein
MRDLLKYKKTILPLVYSQKRSTSKLELVETALQIEKDEMRDRCDAVLDPLRHHKLNYPHTTSYLSL